MVASIIDCGIDDGTGGRGLLLRERCYMFKHPRGSVTAIELGLMFQLLEEGVCLHLVSNAQQWHRPRCVFHWSWRRGRPTAMI